jgi:hypothetical protein
MFDLHQMRSVCVKKGDKERNHGILADIALLPYQ